MPHRKYLIALSILALAAGAASAQVDCSTQLLGSSQGAQGDLDWSAAPVGLGGEYYSVDIATGAGSLIGTMASGLASELEYDILNDELWAEEVDGGPNLHQLNPMTGGTITTVAHTPGGLVGLEFVGSTLYGTFISGPGAPSDLVIVNTGTGALTTIGPTGFGPISGLAYDPVSGIMYGVVGGNPGAGDGGSGGGDLVTVDLASGAATSVGPTGLTAVGGLAFAPNGTLYGGTASNSMTPNSLFTIDPATGAATFVGSVGFSVTGLTACAEVVPVELQSISVE